MARIAVLVHNKRMNSNSIDDLFLDHFDVQLLDALQKNAQATNQELGTQVHLSASQVSRRVQRLESAGFIRQHVVLLDPALVGLHVRAFTYVTLARHGGEEGPEFERDVASLPEVLDCYAVTGESDYILHIVAPSLTEFSESVLKKLMRLRGVAHVRSNIVLHRIKATTQLPLGQIGRPPGPSRLVRLVERVNQEAS
jgi:Lrp/AsnC family leucine-responsive transcriptional regulator